MDLIQITTPSTLSAYVESRKGGRNENQDSYGWKDTPFGFLVCVCDGMGGGPGGKTASRIAVENIIKGVMEGNDNEPVSDILVNAVRRANLAILSHANANRQLKGMGSTCTALLINGECATVAHVGDSRIYQIRGRNKVFRTFDHSLVFDLVKNKVISEEQARLSCESNVITRALGINEEVEVDSEQLPYWAGDRFVLCTDGIHGAFSEKNLIKLFSKKKISLGALTDYIAVETDSIGNDSGGNHDNLTIAMIETKDDSTMKVKQSVKTKILWFSLILLCAASIALNIIQACGLEPKVKQTPVTEQPSDYENHNDN